MSVVGPMGKSLLARLIVFPITALSALLTTSIVVQSAGGLKFGTIALISTLVQLVPFADLGLGAAVINEISGTSDPRRRMAVFRSAVRKLSVPMVLVIAIAPLGVVVFSWAQLLGITGTAADGVDTVTAIVIAVFAISIPLGLGQRVLVGLGKNHVGVAIAIVTSLSALLLTWLLSLTTIDPIYMAVCPAVAGFLGAATAYALAWRLVRPELKLPLDYKSVEVRGLFRQAAPMIVIMIGIPIAFQTHRILLSLRSNPAELSEYSLAMQFYFPMWSFITVAATSLWPVFARGRSQGELQVKNVVHGFLILALLGAILASLLCAFGSEIGTIVSSDQITLGDTVLVAAAILLFVQSLQQVPGMFLTDTPGLWFQALCIVFLSVWTLSAGWWVTPALGAVGPLAATASGVVLFQLLPGAFRVSQVLRKQEPA